MFRLIFLLGISILFSVLNQYHCQVWPGVSMTIPSAYQGAHLNRIISTGASPRSAIDDIRGLPLFGGMGPSANVNRMSNPDTLRQMLMMQMTGAMTMLTGMALDDVPPILMNGMPMARGNGMVNTNGMAAPSRNRGMIIDDVPVQNGAMDGMLVEPEGGGIPWTGGMPIGAGSNTLPFTGGMSMGAGGNGMPAGGMPMGAGGMPAGVMPMGVGGMPAGVMPMGAGGNGMPAAGGMPMDAASNLPLYANMAMINVMEMLRGIGSMPMRQSAKANKLMAIMEEAPANAANEMTGAETTTSSNSDTTTPKDL